MHNNTFNALLSSHLVGKSNDQKIKNMDNTIKNLSKFGSPNKELEIKLKLFLSGFPSQLWCR